MRRVRAVVVGLVGLLVGLLVVGGTWVPATSAAPPAPSAGEKVFDVTVTADREDVLIGSAVTLRGRVLPASPHQEVKVQRQVGDTWTSVATTVLGPGSRFEVSVTVLEEGAHRYRVVKAGRSPWGQGTSPVVEVTGSTVELTPETWVLDEAEMASFTSYDPTTGRLVFGPKAALGSAGVGTIFAYGWSERTPDGLLRRVTSVTRSADGGWVFATRKASVQEAIGRTLGAQQPQAELVSQTVTPTEGVVLNGSERARTFANIPLPTLSFKLAEELSSAVSNTNNATRQISLSGGGTIALEADLRLDSSIEFLWDQGFLGVDHARLAFHTTLTTTAVSSMSGEVSGKATINLADLVRVYNLQLGPLPVVITDNSELPLEVELGSTADAEVTETSYDTLAAGFDYQDDNGGFSPVFEHSGDHDLTLDDSWQGVDLDMSLSIKEKMKIYGILGAFSSVGAYATTTLAGPSCPVSAGMRLEAGFVVGIDALFVNLEWETSARADVPFLELDPCRDAPATPVITSSSLPDGQYGVGYETQLTTQDFRPGFWTFTGGSLPRGLELSVGGVLKGVPDEDGIFTVPVRFTDTAGRTAETTLTLSITRLKVVDIDVAAGQVGVPYLDSLEANGGPGPYTWTAISGTPPGLELDEDGYLSGVPKEVGSGTIRVQVTDANKMTAEKSLTWRIRDLPPPVDPAGPTTPVNTGTLPPTCTAACGTSWGDPHLVTFDGVSYDEQRVGELTLVRSETDGLRVQVRQQPWNGSRVVSVNTAAAMSVDGDRVGIYLTPTGVRTTVDGTEVTANQALPGGGSLAHDTAGRLVVVRWADGSFVAANYEGGSYITLRVGLAAARSGHVVGLLGDADGDRNDDHRSRAGDVVPLNASVTQLMTDFVDTWRIAQEDSLFDYAEGESTDTFTDPAFPFVQVTASSLPRANVDAAFAACQAAGVVGQAALEACALDVALTGNIAMAAGALQAQAGFGGADNLVANGSFETPAVGGAFDTRGTGATMGAWTVTGGDIDHIRSHWVSAAGFQSLDLNGCSAGRVEQTVPVEEGRRYVLSYAYAGNPNGGLRPVRAEVDGRTVDSRVFDTAGRNTSNMGWARAVTTFVAQDDQATLAFQSELGGCYGPALDDVSLTPVAQPGTVVAASSTDDAWTDASGQSGSAMLSYGHIGCPAIDRYLRCNGGQWPRPVHAPWVWAHQTTRNGEGTVTFRRTVTISPDLAGVPLVLSAWGDDQVVGSVDGTQVFSGGFNAPNTAELTLTEGTHELTFATTNVGGYHPVDNPAGLAWKLEVG